MHTVSAWLQARSEESPAKSDQRLCLLLVRVVRGTARASLFLSLFCASYTAPAPAGQDRLHPDPDLLERPAGVHVLSVVPDPAKVPPLLQAPQRQLLEAKKLGTIGVAEGPAAQVLGAVEAVVMDALGRVVVLDSGFNTLRVYAEDGTALFEAGGPGEGPGRFQRPLSLTLVPPAFLYAGDFDRQLQIFELTGTSLDHLEVRALEIAPRAVCDLDGRLVVTGSSPATPEILHVFQGEDGRPLSFGSIYRSEHALVKYQFSQGRVACDPVTPQILFAPRAGLGEVHSYNPDGTRRWIAQITRFRPADLIERADGGYSVRLPPEGYNRIEALAVIDGAIVVQVANVYLVDPEAGVNEIRGVETYLLSTDARHGALVSTSLDLITAVQGDRFTTLKPEPFPLLTIYQSFGTQ